MGGQNEVVQASRDDDVGRVKRAENRVGTAGSRATAQERPRIRIRHGDPLGGRRRSPKDLHATKYALFAAGTDVQLTGPAVEGDLIATNRFGLRRHGVFLLPERQARTGEQARTTGVGEEPVIADTDEALGQDMQQEAAGELMEWERERSDPATSIVLVAEAHRLRIDVEQTMVRDRNPVRIACQVLQYMFGAVERWFGINDPLGPARRLEVACERGA